MRSTSSGDYILASEADKLEHALAETIRTAGDYFDMVERGELTAAEARAALATVARLDMALLTDDAAEPGLACLIQREGDWTVRIDSPHGAKGYHRRHVHINKRGLSGEYSWNDDGTRHDRHRFPATEQCIGAARKKAAAALQVPVDSLQLVLSERGPIRASARIGRQRSIRTAPSLDLNVRSGHSLVAFGTPVGLVLMQGEGS